MSSMFHALLRPSNYYSTITTAMIRIFLGRKTSTVSSQTINVWDRHGNGKQTWWCLVACMGGGGTTHATTSCWWWGYHGITTTAVGRSVPAATMAVTVDRGTRSWCARGRTPPAVGGWWQPPPARWGGRGEEIKVECGGRAKMQARILLYPPRRILSWWSTGVAILAAALPGYDYDDWLA